MHFKPDHVQSFSLLGRIIPTSEASAVLTGYRAQALVGEHPLASAITDGFGRFLLEWPAKGEQPAFISVRILAPWGDPAGEVRLSPTELLSPSELTFSAVSERRFVPSASEPAVLRPFNSEIVSEQDLSLL